MIIKFLFLFILCINAHILKAQSNNDRDQNPWGMRWREINTENFQIIYPASFETEAQRVANTLQKLVPEVSNSLNKKLPGRISIILQNQSVTSNGFVTLGPRRSEFSTTPAQEFDSQDWLNSLAIHELRHVVQFDKMSGQFANIPFLEAPLSAVLNFQIPSWFWEGDAVATETALTTTGRGRLPSFEMAFRANTLSGIRYSYIKNYLGSFKSATPGYYPLGFFLTTKLRRDYGLTILDRLMTRIKKKPLRLYNLNNSIKQYTKLSIRQLHDSTVSELSRLWEKQLAITKPLVYPAINNRIDKIPTDYLLPTAVSDSQILVIKQSRKRTARLVIINNDKTEENILDIGPQVLSNFSYNAGKVVWDELRNDLRFQKRSFNVINSYDLQTKKYRQLTHRSRLFAPALSPDGKTIVAIFIAYNNDVSLVELDAYTGKVIKRYINPQKWNLQTPQFSQDGNKIVCIVINKRGVGMLEVDRTSGLSTQIINSQKQQITRPTYAGNKIIFKAHYNGIDNIYSIDPANGKILQLGSAKFGAFNPSYDAVGKRILFNNYQPAGLDVASMPYNDKDNNSGIPFKEIKNTFIDYAKPLVLQEGNKDVFDTIPTKIYPSKRYKDVANAFYFYNFVPVWPDITELDKDNIGFKLLSSNKLNTIDINMGYEYNQILKGSEYFASLTYKYLYPILYFTYKNQKRIGNFEAENHSPIPFSWREHEPIFGVSFPFLLSQRNINYAFGLNLSTSFIERYNVTLPTPPFPTHLKFPIIYNIYLNRSTNLSTLDLAPRWGQYFNITYRNFPFPGTENGYLFSFQTTLFTPGFKSNHSFQANFNYQKVAGEYKYDVTIPMVNGYGNLPPTPYFTNTLLLTYQFPIAYPDWEIARVTYIKRLTGGLFSGFENIGHSGKYTPRTVGVQIAAEMNLFGFDFMTSGVTAKVIFASERSLLKPVFEFGYTINY